MLLEQSGHRRSFDSRLGFIMAVGVFLGLIDNSKTIAALPVVSYFVAVLFYRRGLSLKSIVILLVGGAIFSAAVAPIVHALRAMGQQQLTLSERVELLTSRVVALIETPERFGRLTRLASEQFEGG